MCFSVSFDLGRYKNTVNYDWHLISSFLLCHFVNINNFTQKQIDGSNEYYVNPHVIGIGDRAVFVGAIEMFVVMDYAWSELKL
jgi:hypothetical protein